MSDAPRISVLIGHLNRPRHLEVALRTLDECRVPAEAIEVVVTESRSRAGMEPWDAIEKSAIRYCVRRYRIDPLRHPHENSCVPYNLMAAKAAGEILVIMECSVALAGDVLADIWADPPAREWRSYSCYSIDHPTTHRVFEAEPGWPPGSSHGQLLRSISPLVPHKVMHDCETGWYGHQVFRAKPYYWCVAIRRDDFLSVGGFDLRYAHARAFEDDDILRRLVKAGMRTTIRPSPIVVHLAHETAAHTSLNADLYRWCCENSTGPKANGGRVDSPEYPIVCMEEVS